MPFIVGDKSLLLGFPLVVLISPTFGTLFHFNLHVTHSKGFGPSLYEVWASQSLHRLGSLLSDGQSKVFWLRQLDLLPRHGDKLASKWQSLSTSPMSGSCKTRSDNFLIYSLIGPLCFRFIRASLAWNVALPGENCFLILLRSLPMSSRMCQFLSQCTGILYTTREWPCPSNITHWFGLCLGGPSWPLLQNTTPFAAQIFYLVDIPLTIIGFGLVDLKLQGYLSKSPPS